LDAFAVHPRNHRSLICPALATGGPACATSPPASTAEPPAVVANALEDLDHHLDLRIMIAVARGSFSPHQSDTSATAGAHSKLAAGRSTAAGKTGEHPPLAGHLRVHPEYLDHVWEAKGGLGPP